MLNHRYAAIPVDADAVDERPLRHGTVSRPGLIRGIAAGVVVALAVIWTLWPSDAPEPEPPTQALALPEPPPVTTVEPLFKDETIAPAAQTAAVEPPPRMEPAEPPAEPVETGEAATTDEPAAEPASEPPKEKPVAERAAPEPVAAAQVDVAAKPQPQPAATVDQPRGNAWLKSQRKDHYVVQLMATRDPRMLDEFVRTHALGSEAAVFRMRRKGATWHVLLYGLYANADVARASIADLPSGLRKHSPWIRSVASVQKALLESPP